MCNQILLSNVNFFLWSLKFYFNFFKWTAKLLLEQSFAVMCDYVNELLGQRELSTTLQMQRNGAHLYVAGAVMSWHADDICTSKLQIFYLTCTTIKRLTAHFITLNCWNIYNVKLWRTCLHPRFDKRAIILFFLRGTT